MSVRRGSALRRISPESGFEPKNDSRRGSGRGPPRPAPPTAVRLGGRRRASRASTELWLAGPALPRAPPGALRPQTPRPSACRAQSSGSLAPALPRAPPGALRPQTPRPSACRARAEPSALLTTARALLSGPYCPPRPFETGVPVHTRVPVHTSLVCVHGLVCMCMCTDRCVCVCVCTQDYTDWCVCVSTRIRTQIHQSVAWSER